MRHGRALPGASGALRACGPIGLVLLLCACTGAVAADVDRLPPPVPPATSSATSSPSESALGPAGTSPSAPPVAGSPGGGPGADPERGTVSGTALALLAALEVKGRAPRTGYDRDQFGQRWADTDRNGCDTRNDVLRRDLDDLVLDPATAGCVVLSGTLADPFSGRALAFLRGQATSGEVQVDHVVALSDAWQKGAQQWTPDQRLAFANDPLNLLAVDGVLNAQKGDGDAATWLPPDRGFRCAYVARQVAVKARYGAWVTSAERDAVERVLRECPGEPVPDQDPVPVRSHAQAAPVPPPAPPPAAVPAPAPAPPPAHEPGAPSSCDSSYPGVCIAPFSEVGDLDCGDVPHRRFVVRPPDPHGFDGDRDGVGCQG